MQGISRRRILGWLAFAALLILENNCTFMHQQMGAPGEEQTINLENTITNIDEVLTRLGPPTGITRTAGGFALLYEYHDMIEKQFGINLEVLGIKWFKAVLADADVDRQVLVLDFDHAGILRSHSRDVVHEELGKGLAVQYIFDMRPVVDTSDYMNAKLSPHEWGFSLLTALPMTLNLSQSLTSGEAGFEQQGTSTGVGQRALEMH